MCCATTAPSSRPQKPGAGSTGSTMCPSATRRVGTAGRVWKISNSASSTVRFASDVRTADPAQLAGGDGDGVRLGGALDRGDDRLGAGDDHRPGPAGEAE